VEGSFTSLPFGDGLTTASGGSDADASHYATLDHDYESDTEHADFRQYSSAQGHWLSPDPYSGSYDFSNPQSFNRYVYATNNPLGLVDASGLNACVDNASIYCSLPNFGDNDGTANELSEGLSTFGPSVTTSAGIFGTGNFTWNGWAWVNNYNGDEIDDAAAEEEGLGTPLVMSFGPAISPSGCSATQAVSFIKTNQAAAAKVAQQLGVPTQNVLGLSGIESTWGTSNAATQANNFFGLHGGANAPFATGVWYTGGGQAMSSFPSYLASAQSFAEQYGGYVQGVTNPTAFAQALVTAGFNPGKAPLGNPNFVRDTAATINATPGRMLCP